MMGKSLITWFIYYILLISDKKNTLNKVKANMNIFPDIYAESVFKINYKKLYEKGIRNIIFDVDNTLISYDESEPNKRLIKLFSYIEKLGFTIFLVSNNTHQRISYFSKNLDFHVVANSNKPLPFKVRRSLKGHTINRCNTVIIGDQLMTDVLVSKFLKIRSILVSPISLKDMWYTKPSRKIENFLLQFDKRIVRYDFR